eukprot:RCo009792
MFTVGSGDGEQSCNFREPSVFLSDKFDAEQILRLQPPLQPVLGLRNLGNTCFLNSVLQVLTKSPGLHGYFHTRKHSTNCKLRQYSGWCAFCEVETLALTSNPVSLVANLKKVMVTYRDRAQEDAHELYRMLLDKMNEPFIFLHASRFSEKERREVTRVLQKDHLTGSTSLLFQLFAGWTVQQVICGYCKGTSNSHQLFLDLSLSIKSNSVQSVEEALAFMCAEELLSNENKYDCDRCKGYTTAKKKVAVHQAPVILALQLQRFAYTGFLTAKNEKYVRFGEKLDLRPYTTHHLTGGRHTGDPDYTYSLYGIIVHHGTHATAGHYVAFVKPTPQHSWVYCNDSQCQRCDPQEVLKQRPYMLFYRRNRPLFPASYRALPENLPITAPPSSEPPVPRKRKAPAVGASPNGSTASPKLSPSAGPVSRCGQGAVAPMNGGPSRSSAVPNGMPHTAASQAPSPKLPSLKVVLQLRGPPGPSSAASSCSGPHLNHHTPSPSPSPSPAAPAAPIPGAATASALGPLIAAAATLSPKPAASAVLIGPLPRPPSGVCESASVPIAAVPAGIPAPSPALPSAPCVPKAPVPAARPAAAAFLPRQLSIHKEKAPLTVTSHQPPAATSSATQSGLQHPQQPVVSSAPTSSTLAVASAQPYPAAGKTHVPADGAAATAPRSGSRSALPTILAALASAVVVAAQRLRSSPMIAGKALPHPHHMPQLPSPPLAPAAAVPRKAPVPSPSPAVPPQTKPSAGLTLPVQAS